MASITTTSISHVSAQTVNNNVVPRNTAIEQTNTSQKIATISISAGNTSKSLESSSSRGAQTPPRSEGTFHERNHKDTEEGSSEGFEQKQSPNQLNLKV